MIPVPFPCWCSPRRDRQAYGHDPGPLPRVDILAAVTAFHPDPPLTRDQRETDVRRDNPRRAAGVDPGRPGHSPYSGGRGLVRLHRIRDPLMIAVGRRADSTPTTTTSVTARPRCSHRCRHRPRLGKCWPRLPERNRPRSRKGWTSTSSWTITPPTRRRRSKPGCTAAAGMSTLRRLRLVDQSGRALVRRTRATTAGLSSGRSARRRRTPPIEPSPIRFPADLSGAYVRTLDYRRAFRLWTKYDILAAVKRFKCLREKNLCHEL